MWEHRLVWTAAKPSWWSAAWAHGLEVLLRQKREPEKRPDTYVVCSDRLDVGLKLRGGDSDEFDVKVLHQRSGPWELWEKVPFFKWNSLEVVRLAALLRVKPPDSGLPEKATPAEGAQAFLTAAGIETLQITVAKTRIQGRAGDLLATVPETAVVSSWLAELAEIEIEGRDAFSVCLESLDPVQGGIEVLPWEGAVACGYPELLVRLSSGSL